MSGNAGMPGWTASPWRRRAAWTWASLSSVPVRLTLRPSTSPGQPSRSASAMRSCRLARISSSRPRWAGSGLRSEHLTQDIRCPLLRVDPAQKARLTAIRDNLTVRIAEAEREGWIGEAEGLQISLAAANNKLAQIEMTIASRHQAVSLGMPAFPGIAQTITQARPATTSPTRLRAAT